MQHDVSSFGAERVGSVNEVSLEDVEEDGEDREEGRDEIEHASPDAVGEKSLELFAPRHRQVNAFQQLCVLSNATKGERHCAEASCLRCRRLSRMASCGGEETRSGGGSMG